jgi:hypothetical protein
MPDLKNMTLYIFLVLLFCAIVFAVVFVIVKIRGKSSSSSSSNIPSCSTCKCNAGYSSGSVFDTCFCTNPITGEQLTCNDANGHSTQFVT